VNNMRRMSLVVMVMALVGLSLPRLTWAQVDSCSAIMTPTNYVPSAQITITVALHNTSGQSIQWIRVVRPTGDYLVNGISVSGWGDVTQSDGTTLTGGNIDPDGTLNFQLSAQAAVYPASAASWMVEVSDDSGGASPTTCTGSLATAIVGHPPNDAGIGTSNVRVTAVGTTTATVAWDSDYVTGQMVYYGLTSNYSSATAYSAAGDSSHSVNLTGLLSGRTYHFQVAGMDGD